MDKFLELMAEVYDIDVEMISPESNLREIQGFSSLIGFSIIVTIEDEYNVEITVPEFLSCNTIAELYDIINKNN